MKIIATPNIDLTLQFSINEKEARALDALAGYGDDAFLKMFYTELGSYYMEKHESGMREFLKTVRDKIPLYLSKIDKAREIFIEQSGVAKQAG